MNKPVKTSDDELTKLEYRVIVNMIPDASSVLDLGCGDGKLLYLLVQNRHVKGRGVEVDENAIYECVSRGLSVSHQDIDGGLSNTAINRSTM
jgi:methionine biosynthesis protein MetW